MDEEYEIWDNQGHLENCDDINCQECERLLEFYEACDECGSWMHKDSLHDAILFEDGRLLCETCQEKEGLR